MEGDYSVFQRYFGDPVDIYQILKDLKFINLHHSWIYETKETMFLK